MFQANSIQHSQKIATNITHICDHGCRLWSEWDLHGFKRTIWPVNGTLPSLLTVLFTSQVLIKSVIELRWESGVWTPQNRRVLGEQRSWCLALLKSDCGCIRHMADYFQRIFEWEQECVSKISTAAPMIPFLTRTRSSPAAGLPSPRVATEPKTKRSVLVSLMIYGFLTSQTTFWG